MAGSTGRPPHDLTSIEAYGLFEALRLIECANRDRPRLGRAARPADDAVRIGQAPSAIFAPSALAAWRPAADGRPARLINRAFGVFGPNGPLPLHLTEYARDRQRHEGDPTLTRFADVFHHRMASFFYRAWAEARPVVQRDRPADDRFAGYVGALLGLPRGGAPGDDPLGDTSRLYFAGLLGGGSRHPDGLRLVLERYFGVPVRVEEFVGRWLTLPERDRLRLGVSPATGTLGRTATVGARVFDRQHGFRVVVGPLGLDDYRRLLPGGPSARRLAELVRAHAGDELDWDLRLVLAKDDVPEPRLGGDVRLGQTTWLGGPGGADRADLLVAPTPRAA